MMTLYDFAMAPNPRRARILLAEKGVAVQRQNVDLRAGEQFSADFRLINPACTVPVLRTEDGELLRDNAAIAAYLEERFPQPPLLGHSAWDKAQVASWNWRAEFEGLMAVAEAFRNSSPAMVDRALPGLRPYAQIPALATRGLERIAVFFDTLDERLRDQPFLAGEHFSIADITALVSVDFARVVACQPDARHPHLLDWRQRLAARPAFAA